ncbi:chemotaxis response regulator protein-glutamate methylesterase [Agaricicola taiwanensis]|uniref:Protein-glutamate methylesterase/protein-glutamine glutaminase n=1 Tax=Agaricicola taiwanensis TaxID=591372 RepID=A0A8J2YGU7_9RHOB|nr:chemotaxis-specific protein-glutamate methyltransferase CheB [Agaricicola taiwanensis]GGE41529.1 chemotaxis response regulator protein-glutamate methylesterase [Agaricicola taiwanensis]
MKRTAGPVKVMIVEDSAVVRLLLTNIISRDPRLAVSTAVTSGEEALAALAKVKPDVISMDIRLPGIDGLETTRRIMEEHPTPIVVIADSVHDGSLKLSMNALRAGALTVVEKPVGVASSAYEEIASQICTQLYIMSQVSVIRRRGILARTAQSLPPSPPPVPHLSPEQSNIIGIAASTGGPPALARVIGALPKNFPLPVLVVQHMGAPFMEGFASWLNGLVPLDVTLAKDNEVARPGRVYVAPGDRHLVLSEGNVLRLTGDPPISSQRPAATELFRSLARHAGRRGCGVVLTGMGEDGARGLLEMRMAGGRTLAEHESSCVVFGMPGAAIRLGAVETVLPLDAIGERLLQIAGMGES